jgi:hypothetical protein
MHDDKSYYQDVANLLAELDMKKYTDEIYEMMLDNPAYFSLLFPNHGASKQERGNPDGE